MRVLVTGNCGFIGNIMVPMLQNRGHEVVGLDSDLYERSTFGDSVPEVDTIGCDIRDANVVLTLVGGRKVFPR